jgi:hypothetical protein
MTEQPGVPEVGEGTDIDAAQLDLDSPTDPPATSDATEYVEDGETLGGTGGLNAGGAG